jgi:hypothetical protein
LIYIYIVYDPSVAREYNSQATLIKTSASSITTKLQEMIGNIGSIGSGFVECGVPLRWTQLSQLKLYALMNQSLAGGEMMTGYDFKKQRFRVEIVQ